MCVLIPVNIAQIIPPHQNVEQVIEVGQWNHLDCVYRGHFDHIDHLTWSRNDQVFITYPQDFEGLRFVCIVLLKYFYEWCMGWNGIWSSPHYRQPSVFLFCFLPV